MPINSGPPRSPYLRFGTYWEQLADYGPRRPDTTGHNKIGPRRVVTGEAQSGLFYNCALGGSRTHTGRVLNRLTDGRS
jgi:hypothetical protein